MSTGALSEISRRRFLISSSAAVAAALAPPNTDLSLPR